MKIIPYARQSISASDISAVVKVLNSDRITQGPKIAEFERALCRYTGAKYAVVVSSGTAALHIACLAAGIKKGDSVITSPITFVASANCALYCGARPVFADIKADSANIDPDKIRKKINAETKAIIPVHFAGNPCDLEKIRNIAKQYSLMVIEDAAHALGAKYNGSKIGSGKYSDMTVFSFHPAKNITTGEGGAVLTNDGKLFQRLMMLRSHGITRDTKLFRKNPGPWYYEMQMLGFNYRITDVQAALGLSQLKRLESFLAQKRAIAKTYDESFKNVSWIKPLNRSPDSALHLYVILIDYKKLNKTKNEIMRYLGKQGICTQVHYIPVYRQPYYEKHFTYSPAEFPNAESYYAQALTLPFYAGLTKEQLGLVIKKILGIPEQGTRVK